MAWQRPSGYYLETNQPTTIMSIYHKSQPTAQSLFRENTAAHKKMLGVQTPHFTCAACHEHKPTAGRRRATPSTHRDGYLCCDCQTIEMDGYNGHRKEGVDYSVALRDQMKVIIQRQGMTYYEIARRADRLHSTVVTVVKKLKRDGLLHIDGWRKTPGRTGPMEALFIWGPGKDAAKPARDTSAEKCQRYRNKTKGVHHSQLIKRDPLMAMLYGRS